MRLTGFWRWCAFVLLVAALGYALIQPSNDRDWTHDQRVMPRASFRGQYVDVTGIRNVEYRSTDDSPSGTTTRLSISTPSTRPGSSSNHSTPAWKDRPTPL